MEKVLITGNQGYIGTILVEELIKEDFIIYGLDTNFYQDRFLYDFENVEEIQQINKDLRRITLEDLKGFDSIIHLAALSNDPLAALNPALTNEINFKSSLDLAKLAKKAKVSRFIFSSSCSIYGETNNEQLSENDRLNPLTPYAHSKVNFEQLLS